ncbi:T9SS type A sorting domain-containing protein [Weeksellaceae bacterium KMM 9713]|uniref:T9SS type A sorting domain-containing protein n=1 Tax=Profundicola chukchiensis TaxID=2961959 RepID=A0A9X4N119_9FLAO|nr:T9SS type A sorting domain-containing protein [Profundicola chukchiensis]MDG4946925.1 T9SS type A sorting domain-containing protein [Profundicola chukchiensis]MDG4951415.1 T9SS type A sorting domain-containing protein [Profundicola chukchiensis]
MSKFYRFLSAFLVLGCVVNAQYTLTVEDTPYEEITNGTSITNGIIWQEIQGELPLGFDFTLEDITFNTLYVTTSTTEGLLLPTLDFSQNMPVICAVVAEFADRNAIDFDSLGEEGGLSDVSYTTIGEPGERIFILQYKNVGFEDEIWDNDSSNDFMNFQIWLYEGSNKIAYHFGSSEINYPDSSFWGVPGPSIGLFSELQFELENNYVVDFYPMDNGYFILGDSDNPILSVQTDEEIMGVGDIFFTGVPAEHKKLILEPSNLGVNDLIISQSYKLKNNPVHNSLQLNSIERIEKIEIYDLNGRRLKSVMPSNNIIPVEFLQKGMYVLKLYSDNKEFNIKFIKK